MIALLFAGQHTSSITTSWTGLRMARDPKLVYVKAPTGELRLLTLRYSERVVAEQKQVLAKYNGGTNVVQ